MQFAENLPLADIRNAIGRLWTENIAMKSLSYLAIASLALLCSCGEAGSTSDPDVGLQVQTDQRPERTEVPQPDPEQYELTSSGPLSLEMVRRVSLPRRSTGNSPPSISPDGTKFFAYNGIQGLWVNSVMSDEAANNPVGRVALEGFGHAETVPFTWSANSRSILGVRQATAVPSGFAQGPMSTVEIAVDGSVRELPGLEHRAGNLDGLLWVGNRGLALAEFGTKGSYYKPELDNAEPTLAIVDARRGRVIQSFEMPPSVGPRNRTLITGVDARIDGNGRVFALLAATGDPNGTRWFLLRQGNAIRQLAMDVGRVSPKRFAVTPDLKSVLVVHDLSATGVICEIWSQQPCPPPTPVSGTVADLRDLETGRIIWSIRGTATNFSRGIKPAISNDGNYALIAIPPNEGGGETIALISMRDGRVLQEIDNLPTFAESVSFSEDDEMIWISGLDLLFSYRMQ
ncbi:hypothetical protein [Croceicoccus pelagius]|nr:hypothetical protein [Croceicoccus pelagius]